MKMRSAIENYYTNLCDNTISKNGLPPMAGWDREWNQEIYISKPNENEKAVWKPVFTDCDAEPGSLIGEIGFEPSALMMDYFFTGVFPALRGSYNGVDFTFTSVGLKCSQKESLVKAARYGAEASGRRFFCLGCASAGGNDSISIYFDDEKEQLLLATTEGGELLLLSGTPADIISKMVAY